MYKFLLLINLLFFFLLGCNTAKNQSETSQNDEKTKISRTKKHIEKEINKNKISDSLLYQNSIFDENVKTVLFFQKGWELTPPFLELNSGKQLVLKFDDLGKDFRNFSYTIIHCDKNWKPSDLMQNYYLDGFFQDFIDDNQFSQSERQPYYHFTLDIPNQNLKITKSGNYILKVFANNDDDKVVLTRRFVVYENLCGISQTIRLTGVNGQSDQKQEIDFKVNISNLDVTNSYNDIDINILKNSSWEHAIKGLKPIFNQGDVLVYDYNGYENAFDGGNEFRFLNIKSVRTPSLGISNFVLDKDLIEVYTTTSEVRTYKSYFTQEDLNGKFLVHIQERNDNHLESDYVKVHLKLYSRKEFDEDIYIYGALSDWKINEKFKMEYNFDLNQYEKTLLLKQGYYNYIYVGKNKDGSINETLVEGNHVKTDNEYDLFVFMRDRKLNLDRVVGYKHFLINN